MQRDRVVSGGLLVPPEWLGGDAGARETAASVIGSGAIEVIRKDEGIEAPASTWSDQSNAVLIQDLLFYGHRKKSFKSNGLWVLLPN